MKQTTFFNLFFFTLGLLALCQPGLAQGGKYKIGDQVYYCAVTWGGEMVWAKGLVAAYDPGYPEEPYEVKWVQSDCPNRYGNVFLKEENMFTEPKTECNYCSGGFPAQVRLDVKQDKVLTFLSNGGVNYIYEQANPLYPPTLVKKFDDSDKPFGFAGHDAEQKFFVVTAGGAGTASFNLKTVTGAGNPVTQPFPLGESSLNDDTKLQTVFSNGKGMFAYQAKGEIHSSGYFHAFNGEGASQGTTFTGSHNFGHRALYDGSHWVILSANDATPAPGVNIQKLVGSELKKRMIFSSPLYWDPTYEHNMIRAYYPRLAGFGCDADGYGVAFVSPKHTTAPTNMPYNIGYVHVVKDFQDKTGSQQDITGSGLLDNTGTEHNRTVFFGVKNTDPREVKQKVAWVTDYTEASGKYPANPCLVYLPDANRYLVIWEETIAQGNKYVSTKACLLTNTGEIKATKDIGAHRLNPVDNLYSWDGKGVWATVTSGNKVKMNIISVANDQITHFAQETNLPQ